MSNTFNTVPTQFPAEPYSEPYAEPYAGSHVQPGTDLPAGSDAPSTKEEIGNVGDVTAKAAHKIADSGLEGASRVADEAKTQTQNLIEEARTQLSEQAAVQQARAADGLRVVSDDLSTMIASSETSGVAHDLVQQVATRTGSISSWLDSRDPAALLQEVRTFARRKPGAFIALGVTAGILAGRLTRNVVANETDHSAADASVNHGDSLPVYDRGAVR